MTAPEAKDMERESALDALARDAGPLGAAVCVLRRLAESDHTERAPLRRTVEDPADHVLRGWQDRMSRTG